MKKIIHIFDKLEDHVRGWFSHRPILYGFVGGLGLVFFERGIWHTSDFISSVMLGWGGGTATRDFAELWDGLLFSFGGIVLLLITGIFVSSFIGNEIIISGLKREKKLTEKTEEDVEVETGELVIIQEEIRNISKKLDEIQKSISK